MKKYLYIDCDGVIYNSVNLAFKEMEEMGVDTNNQVYIDNYFKHVNWDHLINKDTIINDSLKKIKDLIDSNEFFSVQVLTHISCFYEAIFKTEEIESQIPGVEVITLPRLIGKETILDPSNSILVDDALYKIKDWTKKGGIGVWFNQNVTSIVEPFEISYDQDYYITNNLEDLIKINELLHSKQKVRKF